MSPQRLSTTAAIPRGNRPGRFFDLTSTRGEQRCRAGDRLGYRETDPVRGCRGYRVSPVFTLLAGARWVDLENQIRYTGEILDEDVSAGKSWIDPFVGVHIMAPFAERWWFGAHGDIGGFGVGSELAWQAYADVGFDASKVVSIILGYRAIEMDYEDGSGRDLFRYDMLSPGRRSVWPSASEAHRRNFMLRLVDSPLECCWSSRAR